MPRPQWNLQHSARREVQNPFPNNVVAIRRSEAPADTSCLPTLHPIQWHQCLFPITTAGGWRRVSPAKADWRVCFPFQNSAAFPIDANEICQRADWSLLGSHRLLFSRELASGLSARYPGDPQTSTMLEAQKHVYRNAGRSCPQPHSLLWSFHRERGSTPSGPQRTQSSSTD